MARRLIHTVHCEQFFAKIYRDSEWNEYRVVFNGDSKATYHTDDKADAFVTAETAVMKMFAESTETQCEVEVLQGADASWQNGMTDKYYPQSSAIAAAQRINAEHFTATRVVNKAGNVLFFVMPDNPEIAYPGDWGKPARDALAHIFAFVQRRNRGTKVLKSWLITAYS